MNEQKTKACAIPHPQPSESIDTPEFRGLMLAASTAWPTQVKQIKALVHFIDAKLTQAREEGHYQACAEIAHLRSKIKPARIADEPDLIAENVELRARFEAAEAQLADIRASVEDWDKYASSTTKDEQNGDLLTFLCGLKVILAQSQSTDTSGQPG